MTANKAIFERLEKRGTTEETSGATIGSTALTAPLVKIGHHTLVARRANGSLAIRHAIK